MKNKLNDLYIQFENMKEDYELHISKLDFHVKQSESLESSLWALGKRIERIEQGKNGF